MKYNSKPLSTGTKSPAIVQLNAVFGQYSFPRCHFVIGCEFLQKIRSKKISKLRSRR